jgi:16S rRNA (guanine527-N7)-methyltransferase
MTASEIPARVDGLAHRYGLPALAGHQLRTLLDLLVTDELAPTAVRDPSRVVDDHLADSLVALELDDIHSAAVVADVGSGAGLPGLPLSIALPGTRFFLLESARRKCAFLDRAIESCALPNVAVVCARVEAWSDGRGVCDVVTARALAPLVTVAEYAAPLLKVGGILIDWRGRRDLDGEAVAARAAPGLGLEAGTIHKVQPYPEAEHRHLHLMRKVMDTPARFPRRPGMAAKRPLGAA